ncbi:amino acid ABC transporter permease [Microbacterium sp. RD1]|uniref:amino acid ABC transporter permease n=1 Tax=Microbacterium sp. RD1 TaxID=3457313 RepID=UPI003FA6034A
MRARPDLPLRRAHRIGETLATLAVAALGVAFVIWCATNEGFGWQYVGEYLFAPGILVGLGNTLLLTVESAAIGLVLGTLIAVMRLSPIRALAVPAWFFALFFRGTPLLVQVIFWYNLAVLIPRVELAIPGIGTVFHADVNAMITPLTAALLALGLNEAAYMSEIIRGGILGVDRGQVDAAKSLGMRPGRILQRILLPQAMRTIIPPMGNEIIGLLKATSLVSVIAVSDLLFAAQAIYSQNLRIIPLLIVASIWYLVATTVMSIGQFYLERYYARGTTRTTAPTFRQVLTSSIARFHAPQATRNGGDL